MPPAFFPPQTLRGAETLEGRVTAVTVVGLFAWTFLARAGFLLGTPFPVGVDGYYYAVQVRSLLEGGHLYYPASPLVFWWLAPFSALTDPIVGTKLGAAAGTAACVFPTYLLSRRLSGDRWAGLVGAAIAATSAQSFYLATEFVKQGVGLTLTLGVLAALASALAHPNRQRVALTILLLGLTLLAHKLAFALALFVATPALALELWRRKLWPRVGVLALAGLSSLVLVAVLAREYLPGAEGLHLLAHTFRRKLDGSFATLIRGDGVRLFFRHEVLLAVLAAVGVLTVRLRDRSAARPDAAREALPPVAVGLVLLALLLALPWLNAEDRQGLAMRLRLTAFMVLAPCSALVAERLLRPLSKSARALAAMGVTAAMLVLLPSSSREGTVFVGPERAEAVRALEGILPPDALVITTDRQLAFMTTWHTQVSARKSAPRDIPQERTYRLIPRKALEPALAGALKASLAPWLPQGLQPRDLLPHRPHEMVLFPERGFQTLVVNLPEESQQYWRQWPAR